jgi:8-oxo-dGTP pyrophosphatase MutT (NUDIX family)
MQLIFSDQPLPDRQVKSLFLAGPSPRRADEADWRPRALELLQELGYEGTVFIPIPAHRYHAAGGHPGFANPAGWSYDDQVSWERDARAMADLIVFWVPRVIDASKPDLGMPAFTTNFELGEDLTTGRVLYGRPPSAVKCAYLDQRGRESGLQVHEALDSLLASAVKRLGAGAERQGGEAQVPLAVWTTAMFQSWYANQVAAGNRLDGARLLFRFVVGRGFTFTFVMKVKVWVQAEQRHKSNEVIVARPDTSAVVAAYREQRTGGQQVLHVVLVREFRSPVNNAAAMVYELPAGSTTKPGSAPEVNAREELHEETGLVIEDATRFMPVSTRQLAATFSTHRASVYAVELTEQEFRALAATAEKGEPLGDALAGGSGASGERTYVQLATLADVFELPVDYATLGMTVEGLRTLGMLSVPR